MYLAKCLPILQAIVAFQAFPFVWSIHEYDTELANLV